MAHPAAKRRRGARRMRHIFTDEVSLVDEPATFRSFYVVKGKGATMDEDMVEALIDLCGDDIPENFEEVLKSAKLSPKAVKKFKTSLRILTKYQSDFPDEVQKAVGVLAIAAGSSFTEPAGKTVAKVRLSKHDREQLDDVLDLLKNLSKSQKALKPLLSDVKGASKKKTKTKSKDVDDDSITLSQDDLDDLLDSTATQTLIGVGLLKESDLKSKRKSTDDEDEEEDEDDDELEEETEDDEEDLDDDDDDEESDDEEDDDEE